LHITWIIITVQTVLLKYFIMVKGFETFWKPNKAQNTTKPT